MHCATTYLQFWRKLFFSGPVTTITILCTKCWCFRILITTTAFSSFHIVTKILEQIKVESTKCDFAKVYPKNNSVVFLHQIVLNKYNKMSARNKITNIRRISVRLSFEFEYSCKTSSYIHAVLVSCQIKEIKKNID